MGAFGHLGHLVTFSALNDEQQEQITRPFNEFNVSIKYQGMLVAIRDTSRWLDEEKYHRILKKYIKP